MLVLSRRLQDRVNLRVKLADLKASLDLGEELSIDVVVVDIDRNKVRIGFDAPRFVEIFRSELLEKPNAEGGSDGPKIPG